MPTLYGSRYDEPWRGLPGEIRNSIWRFCAHHEDPITLCKPTSPRECGSPLTCRLRLGLGAMRTCREASEMMSQALYTDNAFHFDAGGPDVLSFFQWLPKATRLLMRDVRFSEMSIAVDNGANILASEDVLDMLLNHMSLSSVTIPIWEDYGMGLDDWYYKLIKAVTIGQIHKLRLHSCLSRPENANHNCLMELYHLMRAIAVYEECVGDKFPAEAQSSCWQMRFGDNPPKIERLKPIREHLVQLLWEYRRMYPFSVTFEASRPEMPGFVVAVQHDLPGAKARLAEMEDLMRGSGDQSTEQEALYPLQLPGPEARLVFTRRNLAFYEKFMLKIPGEE